MKPLYQGEARDLYFRLVTDNGEPASLSSSEITASFLKSDRTYLNLTFGDGDIVFVGNSVLWKFKVSISAADSALLRPDERPEVQIKIDTGTKTYIFRRQIMPIRQSFS